MLLTFLSIIFVFSIFIISHELGHLLLARKFGIKVEKFSLGFGLPLLKFKGKETEYLISLVPLGGYVKIAGMEPGERDHPRGFYGKSLRERLIVVGAGSFMNYLVGIILFSLVFSLGFYTLDTESTIVGEVKKGFPAEEVGIKPGDRIVEVEGRKAQKWQDLFLFIGKSEKKSISLKVEREGELFLLRVSPRLEGGRKVIGISPRKVFVKLNPLFAFGEGIKKAAFLSWAIIYSLGAMIGGKLPLELTGPVGIARIIGKGAKMGFVPLIGLTAFISINLGLINLFPLPALDGSRIVFLLLEWIRKKPLKPQVEEFIQYVGFLVLMGLIILITYQDLARWLFRD